MIRNKLETLAKRKKRCFLTIPLCLVLPVLVHGQQKCDFATLYTGQGYTMCRPSGLDDLGTQDWFHQFENKGVHVWLGFGMLQGKVPFSELLIAQIEEDLAQLRKNGGTDARLVDLSDFKTDGGLSGVRMIFLGERNGVTRKLLAYYIDSSPDTKFSLTATVPQDDKTWTSLIDMDVKTFKLSK